MTLDTQHLIEITVAEDAGAVPDMTVVHGRAARRRRRRSRVRVVGGLAAVAVVALVGVELRGGSGTEELATRADDPGAGTMEVTLADLSGRRVRLTLPEALGAGFSVVAQSAELSVDGRSWRVDALRGSGTGIPTTCWEPGQIGLGGAVGDWTVEFSGDDMTPEACAALQAELTSFEATAAGVVYEGTGSVGPVDGPHVQAATDAGRISLLHRQCEASGTTTPAGLHHGQIDDPARPAPLTTFCDPGAGVELWIETAEVPSPTEIDAVGITLG